jgi:hypothetical protein
MCGVAWAGHALILAAVEVAFVLGAIVLPPSGRGTPRRSTMVALTLL